MAETNIEDRVSALETRMAEKDVQFAVINTKLSAILWGVGVTGTAMIGILLKQNTRIYLMQVELNA